MCACVRALHLCKGRGAGGGLTLVSPSRIRPDHPIIFSK